MGKMERLNELPQAVRLLPMAGTGYPLRRSGWSRDIRALWPVEARTAARVPMMAARIACGFPSPADDYMDKPLDFNELLITNQPAIFCAEIEGDSMEGVGLFKRDIVVINRARAATDGDIVFMLVGSEFTIKTYRLKDGRCWLQPENPRYSNIYPIEGVEWELQGVIEHSIRRLLRKP